MFNGYLEMGGTEIVNAARTAAYVRHGIGGLTLTECDGCEDLAEILGHDPYESPLVDEPGWFDADNVDSWDFYGLYPLSVDGFENGVTTASVTELMGPGASITRPRRASRQLRVTGLLIGRTDAALAYGMTWLRNALLGNGCRDSLTCTGDHLCYFSACPPVCSDSPDWPDQDGDGITDPDTVNPVRSCEDGVVLGPLSQCTAAYERVLYDVTLLDGPRIVQRYPSNSAHYVRVEFTMVAATPSPVGVAARAFGPETATSATLVPEIGCIAGQRATRWNLFKSPAFNGDIEHYLWGLIDERSNNDPQPGVFLLGAPGEPPADQTPLPEVTRTLRVTVQASSDSPRLATIPDIGRPGPNNEALPRPAGQVPHTASVYVRASRDIRANLQVAFHNTHYITIGTSSVGVANIGADQWGRVSLTFTPPADTAFMTVQGWGDAAGGTANAGDITWWTASLLEPAPRTNAYFDGDTPDGDPLLYGWSGDEGFSISTQYTVVDELPLIVDPDCPPIPAPPRVPVVAVACLVAPEFWRRYQYLVSDDLVPLWGDALPYLTIDTGATAVRQVRVRFYANPFSYDLADLDPCDFCNEFVVSYIPPNSRLLVDSIRQEASISSPGGVLRAASHLLYSSDGGAMQWGALSCGVAYTLAVDASPETATDMSVSLCLAPRE